MLVKIVVISLTFYVLCTESGIYQQQHHACTSVAVWIFQGSIFPQGSIIAMKTVNNLQNLFFVVCQLRGLSLAKASELAIHKPLFTIKNYKLFLQIFIFKTSDSLLPYWLVILAFFYLFILMWTEKSSIGKLRVWRWVTGSCVAWSVCESPSC